MRSTGAAIKVGLTVMVIAILAFGGFRWISKGISGGAGYSVWALFRDATGLVDKSRVQIAGLNIGEIGDRRLDGAFARVTIRLKPNVKLYTNATIFKKSASLLGEFYLEIDPGTPESPDPLTGQIIQNRQLQDGDQIKNVVEAVTVTDILVQVNETLPVLRQILLDVQKLTQGPLRQIAESVREGVDKNSEAAQTLLKHLDEVALNVKGITGGQANEDLKKSLANIRDITEGVRSLVGKGGSEMDETGQKVRTTLDKISFAIDSLNHTLQNTQAISDRVNRGEGTVGRLLNDDTIANNVEQITTDVGGFVSSITRLQTLVGLRSEYNVVANTLKTYVQIQLQSRPDKFFLIELVDDPRGSRSTTQTLTITDDPSKPQTTNTTTISTTDKFRFSFQIGKRLFLLNNKVILTGRFGIKESTGGIGMDVTLPLSLASGWMRTLEIQTDMFDFRTNIWPRLKVLAALEFYKHIWVVGGIDDAFNDRGPGAGALTGRDYFIGAQLTFNDDDLRALLTIGGAALLGSAGK
ncbi:MAG TPA: MlaD family protein [Polyangia bacterium]|nr:MlaD family protein [Polyangia bacterium]